MSLKILICLTHYLKFCRDFYLFLAIKKSNKIAIISRWTIVESSFRTSLRDLALMLIRDRQQVCRYFRQRQHFDRRWRFRFRHQVDRCRRLRFRHQVKFFDLFKICLNITQISLYVINFFIMFRKLHKHYVLLKLYIDLHKSFYFWTF
jgi:hypothetical protein